MESFIENRGEDPYFFGTVIISCEDSKLTLIDGQQRTTTFILLLKALLIQLTISIKHTERDGDSGNLHNILVRKRDKVISILYKVTDDGVDEIVENFETTKISSISEIIEIRSWNVEQAITMFNSLNSDGMPLTDADIISAQLYSNAQENRNVFDEKWKELKKIVEEDIKNDCKITIDAVLLQYMYINRSVDKEYISESGAVSVTTPGVRSYYTNKRKDLLQEPLKLVDSLLKERCWFHER